MNPETTRDDWFARFGWAIVLTATLSMSAYSLFYVGRNLGMPWYFAAIVSMCFDGVAVLAADYSLRYARLGLTATGPQLTVIVFGALSAYLNTLHAYFGHEIPMAKLLWAAPPVAAILVFEFHTKWERLTALRNAGRVAEALPPLGRHSWLHHPVASLRTIRVISGERLITIVEREAPRYVANRETKRTEAEHERDVVTRAEKEAQDSRMALDSAVSMADKVRVALRYASATTASGYASWLADNGCPGVSPAYIRQIRASDARKEAVERREGIRAIPSAD